MSVTGHASPRVPAWYPPIDELIRAGRLHEAQELLKALKGKKRDLAAKRRANPASASGEIARSNRVFLAELLRRSGQPEASLRVLGPVVHPLARSHLRPQPHESAEYAASLSRVGAVRQSIRILTALPAPLSPHALHLTALAYLAIWDLESAEKWLGRLIAHPDATLYQRKLARVNISSAWIHLGQHEEAHRLLSRVLRLRDGGPIGEADARQGLEGTGQDRLLRGIAFDLLAQSSLFRNEASEASRWIAKARKEFGPSPGTPFGAYLGKSEALIRLLHHPGHAGSRREVESIKALCAQRGLWESLRDCELQEARILNDVAKLKRIFFGTPYAGFRRKARLELERLGEDPGEHFVWDPPPKGAGRAKPSSAEREAETLVVRNGEGWKGSKLKPGSLVQSLLSVLASDFYRPLTLGEIHDSLFPGGFFNPDSSPDQIHQLLRRLRRWVSELGIPLAIVEENGRYSLHATAPIRLQVEAPEISPEGGLHPRYREYLRALRASPGFEGHFTSVAAARRLGISKVSAVAFLGEALAQGELEKSGQGPATRYRLRSSKPRTSLRYS